jgi:hypothetical protein
METQATGRTYTTQLVLAWLLVGIPLAWGVYRAILSALPLFQ